MVAALFNEQPDLPPLDAEQQFGIAQAEQQQVFARLQTLYQETVEIAKLIF
ncbi:hypothetical protein JWZ98_05895 [Methylomonas sp. EFPC1]|uniref:hypothetical protein n=1 Tax=Methylomonas sp. EFPC1 TaxID=2812647 RepID=UPI001967905F|nr:hypothetical protein [Methylomonas sp. EFPC1]QSB02473.1 hypothetical protein JWZ98_05895 [Methylomonas sp. EFPC1]